MSSGKPERTRQTPETVHWSKTKICESPTKPPTAGSLVTPPDAPMQDRSQIIIDRWLKSKEAKNKEMSSLRKKRMNNERTWIATLNERQNERNRVFEYNARREEAAMHIQGGFRGMQDRKAIKVIKEKKRLDDIAKGKINEKGERIVKEKTAEERLADDAARLFS